MRLRLAVIGLLVALTVTAVVWARGSKSGDKSHACLDMRRCKKGQKPPTCCNPPPCAFSRQIQMKVILQTLYGDKGMRAQAAKKGGDTFMNLFGRIIDMSTDGTINKKLPACAGDPTRDPPSVQTGSDCARYVKKTKMGEDDAHKTFDTCGEFIDAIYRHEDMHRDRCEHMNSSARAHMKLDEQADEEVSSYQAEIDALRGDLHSWYLSCSPTIDAETKLALVKSGVKIMKGGP